MSSHQNTTDGVGQCSAPSEPIRVLCVEPDAGVADLTAAGLEREADRVAVETVATGSEGRARLDDDVDCLVSAYDLSDTDGVELLEAVRREYPELPFVLFTANGSEAVASEAISAGVSEYVRRDAGPDRFEALARRVVALVGRSRTARTRRKRDEHLRQAQAVAGLGSWELDLRTDDLYWSDEVRDLFQIPDGESLSYEQFLEYVHPADEERVADDWRRALDGEEYDIEHRIVTGGGDVRWVRERASVEFDADGTPTAALGVVQDVTGRKRRERELDGQRRRFECLFEHLSQPTVELQYESGEPIVERVNPAFEETFGYDAEAMAGESLDEFIVPPDERADAAAINSRVQRTGEPGTEMVRRRTADGDRYFLLQNAVYDDSKAFAVYTDVTDRQEREARMRTQVEAMEASMEGISILDDTGAYTFMNQAHADVFDYEPEELVGRTWRRLYAEDVIERLETEVFPQVARTGEWRGELVGEKRDGSPVHQEVTLTRLEDGRMICTNSDITDRRERERDLRRFKRAIEASSHSIYMTDRDGTIEYVNPAFETVTGYTAEEAVGRTPSILKSGEHDVKLYEQLWETVLDEETWRGELVNERKDGERYVVNQTVAPVTDEDGETTHFVAINADITERKNREDELHRLRQAIDKAHSALTLVDPARDDDPMVYVNEAFTELCGYQEGELLGRNCRLLQGPGTDTDTVDTLRAAIDDEEPVTVELRNYRNDGTMFWNELTITPVYDTDGDLVRWLGTQRDITERKEREQHLQVMDRILRHNLRNDMTVIAGLVDTIRTEASGVVAAHAESIIAKGDQLLDTARKQRSITDVLLDRPASEDVDVDAVVDRVVAAVSEESPEATIDVDCPDGIVAEASSRIGQAVYELVTNAVEHSDRDAPVVTITVTEDEECVHLAVADGGPRIPEREQQVGTHGEELDPLYHGRGLGLWLVYWIVTHSDGTVQFHENEPRGNVVQVELPRGSPQGEGTEDLVI